jgi:hypothetical protein
MPFRAYIVFWSLKLDPEEPKARKEISIAKAAIRRWCHPALYGRRLIGFVVVTDETAIELAARLKEETQDCHEIENVHVLGAPEADDIACAEVGSFGPLNHWVRCGWVEARQRNSPKDMRRAQRR